MIALSLGKHPPQAAFALMLVFNSLGWNATAAYAATPVPIDTERSSLTIRVYKTGLFAAFAHDHEIHAPVEQGNFDEERQTVEFSVNARALRVIDPGVSESDRSEIQTTMLGPKVLDSEKFQEIRFRSTKVERIAAGKWTVEGVLTLHGQTHPVKVDVQGERGHYRGSTSLRQKDFGITPVSIAGGSVKVKNEIRVEFEMIGKQSGASNREFGSPRLTCIRLFA
jgi:polyisoprenoid-binding protein YceI